MASQFWTPLWHPFYVKTPLWHLNFGHRCGILFMLRHHYGISILDTGVASFLCWDTIMASQFWTPLWHPFYVKTPLWHLKFGHHRGIFSCQDTIVASHSMLFELRQRTTSHQCPTAVGVPNLASVGESRVVMKQ